MKIIFKNNVNCKLQEPIWKTIQWTSVINNKAIHHAPLSMIEKLHQSQLAFSTRIYQAENFTCSSTNHASIVSI